MFSLIAESFYLTQKSQNPRTCCIALLATYYYSPLTLHPLILSSREVFEPLIFTNFHEYTLGKADHIRWRGMKASVATTRTLVLQRSLACEFQGERLPFDVAKLLHRFLGLRLNAKFCKVLFARCWLRARKKFLLSVAEWPVIMGYHDCTWRLVSAQEHKWRVIFMIIRTGTIGWGYSVIGITSLICLSFRLAAWG